MPDLKKTNKRLTGFSKSYRQRKESIWDSLDSTKQATKQTSQEQRLHPRFTLKENHSIETNLPERNIPTARQTLSTP